MQCSFNSISAIVHNYVGKVKPASCFDAGYLVHFFVGDFYEGKPSEKGNTLFFTEELGGELYVTRLYCHDGGLYELFSPASADLDPEAGERVLPLESIDFTIEGGLLLADIVFDDGESVTLRMSLRVGGAQIEK